jgi:hypothetical protein
MSEYQEGKMEGFGRALGAIAAITLMLFAVPPANSSVVIDITQSAGNVDVAATGSLNLTGATLDYSVMILGSFRAVATGI